MSERPLFTLPPNALGQGGRIVHMQDDFDKVIDGTPIHYVGGGSRKTNSFATTVIVERVTCKTCLRMLKRV